MHATLKSIIAAGLASMALPAAAQQQDTAASASDIYATFYVCDISREARASEIFAAVLAPVYEAQVEKA